MGLAYSQMEILEIEQLLKLPTFSLLRSQNAPLILGFLFRAFKKKLKPSIPEGELLAMLESYLADVRSDNPDAFPGSASDYLATWRDHNHGFIRRSYLEQGDEAVYELTSGSEKALLWIESLGHVEFVGTESRLAHIFDGLDEILRFATGDADERIALLLEDARRIHEEIERIRATGQVERYSSVKLSERYAHLISTARELLSDFRTVEENFQRIAQDIAERQLHPGATKGSIVGHMLDSHDALKSSSQGQSFYAFRELLLSPERRHHFDECVEKARRLPDLAEELRGNPLLSQLIGRLLAEDEIVLSSSQRVSANLRRVLDSSHTSERRRVADLIREIKSLTVTQKEHISDEDALLVIEECRNPYSGMTRGPWKEQIRIEKLGSVMTENGSNWEEFLKFKSLPQIRLGDLRENIEACLKRDDAVVLGTVLDAFPPKHGMMEVIGYVIIASQEDRHYISPDEYTQVNIESGSWNVPLVLFSRRF